MSITATTPGLVIEFGCGRGAFNNPSVSSLPEAGRNRDSGQEVFRSGKQSSFASLPVSLPGHHPLRPVLLERRMPVLPGEGPNTGRRKSAAGALLQAAGGGGDGDIRTVGRIDVEPGPVVP